MDIAKFKDKLFYFIVITIMFCAVPQIIRFKFWGLGSIMNDKLTVYPLLVGILLTVYSLHRERYKLSKYDYRFLAFLGVYGFVILISLIHGLAIYPYFQNLLNGPDGVGQIEKLPKVYNFLMLHHISVSKTDLFQVWFGARFLKMSMLEIVWSFGISWMIFYWYKKDWGKGFTIVRKGVEVSVVAIIVYSVLDILYLSGIWGAESILKVLNPIVHAIKGNGTWYPPLLWPGQLRSLFAEPSHFGIFAAFAIPWLWYSFCKASNRKAQIIFAIIFFAYVTCLFYTKARTANVLFLGEIFLFGFFSLIFRKELLRKYIILMICAIFAFGLSTFTLANFMPGSPEKAQVQQTVKKNQSDSMKKHHDDNSASVAMAKNQSGSMKKYLDDNLGSVATAGQRSNRSRYSILIADLRIGMDHPLLGVGRSLRQAYIPYYLPKDATQSAEVRMWIDRQNREGIMKAGVPNLGEYSTRFAETGLIGLLIYMFPAIFLILKTLKKIREKTISMDDRLKYGFGLISFLGILASGLGDHINITCAYWLMLGLGYAMCFGEKGSIEPMNHG